MLGASHPVTQSHSQQQQCKSKVRYIEQKKKDQRQKFDEII